MATQLVGKLLGILFRKEMKAREAEKTQLEASLALARNQALLAQLQPHFLFNALNSISALIHTDPEAADRMVGETSSGRCGPPGAGWDFGHIKGSYDPYFLNL